MVIASPLKTDRLRLRCLEADDINDRYVGWLNDPLINHYLEVRFERQTIAAVRNFVNAANASGDSLLLGIFLPGSDEFGRHIGNIKIGPIDWHHRRGTIGLLIGDPTCWRKGYASEAIRGLTAHAHDALNIVKVTAGIYASNLASRRAFSNAGYVEEARLKSHWVGANGREDAFLVAHFTDEDRHGRPNPSV